MVIQFIALSKHMKNNIDIHLIYWYTFFIIVRQVLGNHIAEIEQQVPRIARY